MYLYSLQIKRDSNKKNSFQAALPMATINISPYTNVTLTFNFNFGLDHPVHAGYG
jgi:hypothetical protein